MAQVQFAPLQVNPAAGELRHVSRITVRVRFTPSAERTLATSPPAAAAMPVVFDDGLKRTLLNYEDARAWRVDRQAHQLALPVQALTAADPPAYKVVVDQDGLYQLDYAMLQGAGVPVDTLDPPTLRLLNRGEEVAIYVTGESDGAFDAGDTMLFYGEKTDTRFTDTNVYWLTWGSTAGLRLQLTMRRRAVPQRPSRLRRPRTSRRTTTTRPTSQADRRTAITGFGSTSWPQARL